MVLAWTVQLMGAWEDSLSHQSTTECGLGEFTLALRIKQPQSTEHQSSINLCTKSRWVWMI